MVQSSWTIDMIIQVTTMFESCHKKSSIWMQVMVWNNIRLCKYAPPSSNEGIPNDYWCHIDLPLTCTLLPGKALNICRLFLVNPKNSFWAAHTSTCTCKRYNCVYKAWEKLPRLQVSLVRNPRSSNAVSSALQFSRHRPLNHI